MKLCEWCGVDVGEVNYGHLSYWDKNNDIQSGCWHRDCWEEYWKERNRGILRRVLDWIRGSDTSMRNEK